MSDTSARKKLAASSLDRVDTVYCPHKKLSAHVTVSRWQMSDGQWTSWAIVDCPLLDAGLIDCDTSCLSQLEEIRKVDNVAHEKAEGSFIQRPSVGSNEVLESGRGRILPGGANVALRMTDRDVSGVNVLAVGGRIVLGEQSNSLREKVKSLLEAGKKKIVLDLANVTYIDSAGLGTLVATLHSARSQGATLKLTNLGSTVKEVLQVTKLITVFDTYDSESTAIQSFGK